MSGKFTTFVLAAMLIATLADTASALTSATYELQNPRLMGNTAAVDVYATFDLDGSPTAGVRFFQIDVAPSDDALTAMGTDFSRFSFTPASPLLDDWNEFFTFGPDPFASVATYELDTAASAGAALGEAQYFLGVLRAALPAAPPGTMLTVAIDGPDTTAGLEDPLGDFPTFRFVDDVLFADPNEIFVIPPTSGEVPEPAGGVLLVLAALALHRRR